MRTRVRRGDSGQGMVPLMLLVALSVLAVMFSLLVPWGGATTEKAQTQTAADAGALAAVQRQRDVWHDWTAPGRLGFTGPTGPDAGGVLARAAGCAEARTYVSRNEATLYGCSPTTRGGRSQVVVEARYADTPATGTTRAEARATAEIDVDLSRCHWAPPLPPVDPAPPLGTGAPTFDSTLHCGRWKAEYELLNVPPFYLTARLVGPTDRDGLYDSVEPRLVQDRRVLSP